MYNEIHYINLIPKSIVTRYVNEDHFLTPYGGRENRIPTDSFNFHFSLRRQTIEPFVCVRERKIVGRRDRDGKRD